MKPRFRSVGRVAVVAAIGTSAFWIRSAIAPPSDADLLRNFRRNRSCFEDIVVMADAETNVYRIASSFVQLPGYLVPTPQQRRAVLSDDRLNRYLSLFHCAGIDGTPGGISFQNGGVYFQVANGGLTGAGWQKGYQYTNIVPSPLRDGLDDALSEIDNHHPYVQAYRHIDGPWYLEVDGN